MATVDPTALREAIAEQVIALINLPDGTISEARRVPRVDAQEVEALHLVYFIADLDHETFARSLDRSEFTIGLAVQQHLPGNDVESLDALIILVESIKELWQPSGALREMYLANFSFKSLRHAEIYNAVHLLDYGVFTSILELTYQTEID